jgi:hypothetical protein
MKMISPDASLQEACIPEATYQVSLLVILKIQGATEKRRAKLRMGRSLMCDDEDAPKCGYILHCEHEAKNWRARDSNPPGIHELVVLQLLARKAFPL